MKINKKTAKCRTATKFIKNSYEVGKKKLKICADKGSRKCWKKLCKKHNPIYYMAAVRAAVAM